MNIETIKKAGKIGGAGVGASSLLFMFLMDFYKDYQATGIRVMKLEMQIEQAMNDIKEIQIYGAKIRR